MKRSHSLFGFLAAVIFTAFLTATPRACGESHDTTTLTTLGVTPNLVTNGGVITLEASTPAAAGGSGQVTFSIDGTLVGSVPVGTGTTTLQVPVTHPAGEHSVTAHYEGGTNYVGWSWYYYYDDNGQYLYRQWEDVTLVLLPSSGSAKFTVGSPFITVPPENRIVAEGADVQWTCEATGQPPFSYQWRLGGQPIPGETQATLSLAGVRADQAGLYSVVVANALGSVTSVNAALTVYTLSSSLPPGPNPGVPAGSTVTFTTTAQSPVPLSYAWIKNGNPLPGQTSAGLSLTGVSVPDGGAYAVVISDGVVSQTVPAGTFTVLAGPVFEQQPANQILAVGATAQFSCELTGTPPLTYQWRFNGQPMANETGRELTLTAIKAEQAGLYSVLAGNGEGSVPSRDAALTVFSVTNTLPPPPAPPVVDVGFPASFTVNAEGPLPLTFTWEKDGALLAGQTGATLLIPSVQGGDEGAYTVTLQDGAASTEAEAGRLEVGLKVTAWRMAANGSFEFSFYRARGKLYEASASSDLRNWVPLTSWPDVVGPVWVVDAEAVSLPHRSYRVADLTEFITNMMYIPAGTFTMGSPSGEPGRLLNEGPQTQVTLSRGFWMGEYEVTQREYLAVVGNNPARFTADLDRPVEQVTWGDATNYCARLTARERAAGRLPPNWAYRLPTEAEWEYTCRAGTTTATAFGNSLSSTQANFNGNQPYNGGAVGPLVGRTTRVGSYAPNAWGLYDMHGNVHEWCLDYWSGAYPGGAVTDPTGQPWGTTRVNRGGHWSSDGESCRSAFRNYSSSSFDYIGFRVVLAVVP